MSLSRPVPVQNLEPSSKVEQEDIPKILAAIHTAIQAKQKWTLTVNGAENGGIVAIHLKLERAFK